MGKHKPIWDPSTDCGDYVVAVGLHDLHTTGKKRYQKKYYSHTTRPGSLKEITMDRMMEKWGGAEVLRRAVRGMLPKNRLRDDRMARLKSEFLSRKTPKLRTLSNQQICSVRGYRSPLQAKHHQGLHPSFNNTTTRGQGCLCPAEAAMIVSQSLYYLASILHHGVQGKPFHLGYRLGCSNFLSCIRTHVNITALYCQPTFNAQHTNIYYPSFVNAPSSTVPGFY